MRKMSHCSFESRCDFPITDNALENERIRKGNKRRVTFDWQVLTNAGREKLSYFSPTVPAGGHTVWQPDREKQTVGACYYSKVLLNTLKTWAL